MIIKAPSLSPLYLQQFTRELWSEYDAYIMAQLEPAIRDGCYEPKVYKSPDITQEVIASAGYVAHGLSLTPGALLLGFVFPLTSPTSDDFTQVQIQIEDVGLQHKLFSEPIPWYFLSNMKLGMPNLMCVPHPIVVPGRLMVEFWNVSDEELRTQLQYIVLEPKAGFAAEQANCGRGLSGYGDNPSAELQAIRLADLCLSRCGRPIPPTGLASVDLYKGLFYQTVVGNQETQQQTLENTGDTTFFLRAISGIPAPSLVYVQFQMPNGRTLQQTLRPFTQNCGVGSNRQLIDPEIPIEPGEKITITGDTSINNPGTDQPFSVLLEGSERFYLKPNRAFERRVFQSERTATLPRIWNTRNQNPMAPRWMTPDFPGEGESFVYTTSEAVFAVPSAGGGSNNKVQVPTEVGFHFWMRRFWAVYTFDDLTSGTPYIRVREGSGRRLHDDYVNLDSQNGQTYPEWWYVAPGRDIIVDLNIVDSSGAGNITVQYFFEGVRRGIGA